CSKQEDRAVPAFASRPQETIPASLCRRHLRVAALCPLCGIARCGRAHGPVCADTANLVELAPSHRPEAAEADRRGPPRCGGTKATSPPSDRRRHWDPVEDISHAP